MKERSPLKIPQPLKDQGNYLISNQKRLISTVESNQQTKNKNKQVDIGQIHRQRNREILIIGIGTGQDIKINNRSPSKDQNT